MTLQSKGNNRRDQSIGNLEKVPHAPELHITLRDIGICLSLVRVDPNICTNHDTWNPHCLGKKDIGRKQQAFRNAMSILSAIYFHSFWTMNSNTPQLSFRSWRATIYSKTKSRGLENLRATHRALPHISFIFPSSYQLASRMISANVLLSRERWDWDIMICHTTNEAKRNGWIGVQRGMDDIYETSWYARGG